MLVTLNQILKKAQKEHYAVGLFNSINMEMIEATISAAEEIKSPIIIGTAEVLLPYGELNLIAPSIIERAKNASVPVVVHYDHGLTFNRCIEAMKLGFTSVMYDCSTLSEHDNIAAVAEMTKIAHAFGCSIEAEIGHVGGAEDVSAESPADSSEYTKTEDAVNFVNATGVDALAVAVGTAHGVYKVKPVLDLNRIADIRANLKTPLVLHGGSGLSDDDFKNTIINGIAKINIFTDMCKAGEKAMREGLASGKSYLDLRNMQVEAIKKEVVNKMKLFGSVNKA